MDISGEKKTWRMWYRIRFWTHLNISGNWRSRNISVPGWYGFLWITATGFIIRIRKTVGWRKCRRQPAMFQEQRMWNFMSCFVHFRKTAGWSSCYIMGNSSRPERSGRCWIWRKRRSKAACTEERRSCG